MKCQISEKEQDALNQGLLHTLDSRLESARGKVEVQHKHVKKVQNRLRKKIIRLPVYDLLFNPVYRFMFEYHARIWYTF